MLSTGRSGSMATWRKLVGGAVCGAILSASATSWAAYTGTPPLLVVDGGTGAATFTAHGVILGEGTAALGVTAVGTTGIPLIGQTGADPVFGTALVAGGGTGLATLTANSVLVGAGTSAIHMIGTSSTADSSLHWGAAGADPGLLAFPNCADSGGNHLNYTTAAHTLTCGTTSGATVIPTVATATGATPIAITATNLLTTIISMATPTASTINLPTAVQTAGFRLCVKDGTTNFATNNATVKSPTSGTIDGVAGATGVVMNQARQELCFISDATNWFIE